MLSQSICVRHIQIDFVKIVEKVPSGLHLDDCTIVQTVSDLRLTAGLPNFNMSVCVGGGGGDKILGLLIAGSFYSTKVLSCFIS